MEWVKEILTFCVFFSIFVTSYLLNHDVRSRSKEDAEQEGKGKRGQGSTYLEV